MGRDLLHHQPHGYIDRLQLRHFGLTQRTRIGVGQQAHLQSQGG
jgi:hypothetical protein